MSTKIVHQTNSWGGKEVVHLEVDWNGEYVFITVEDDKIIIQTYKEIKAKQEALNYVEITK